MSYVGKMKDLIELYLAELERDGFDNSCGIPLPDAKELLLDFAQWLEDDVQDTESTPEGNDTVWEDHRNWLIAQEEIPNITGLGDIVDSPVDDWDMPSQEEIDRLSRLKAQRIHRLRTNAALGLLNILNGEDDVE